MTFRAASSPALVEMAAGFLDLAWGRLELADFEGAASVRVLRPPTLPEVADLPAALAAALEKPIGRPRLRERVKASDRVVLVVSDKARVHPKTAMLRAVLEELSHVPRENIAALIANGTHVPSRPDEVGVDWAALGSLAVHSHDAHDASAHRSLGRTPRRLFDFYLPAVGRELGRSLRLLPSDLRGVLAGLASRDRREVRAHLGYGPLARSFLLLAAGLGTPVLVHRLLAEADHAISVGQIKNHYFAGYSGGAKGFVPGCAGYRTILANHLLKTDPSADTGLADENLLRRDLEACVALLGDKTFVLDVVADAWGRVVHVTAGDPVAAHRAAVPFADRAARAPLERRAPIVVAAAGRPMGMSVYQLLKAVAPAARAVEPGGTVILCGSCEEGIGGRPLVVREAIWNMGVSRRLPPGARLVLAAGLSGAELELLPFAEPAESPGAALRRELARRPGAGVVVLPNADVCLPEPAEHAVREPAEGEPRHEGPPATA